MQRRTFLQLAGALVAAPALAATPESSDLEQHDLRLDGDPKIARRALLLVPRNVPPGTKLPVLVLLHGLGETGNELLGIHAWGERYGLVRAHERLRHPPVQRIVSRLPYLAERRRAELNESLARQPFRGLVLACPVTPNPHRLQPAGATLDKYAAWIADVLLPAVRARAPVASGPKATGLDGCSLGGYVGLEVFLRKPELFGTFGSVQGAFSVAGARRYAERIAEAIGRVGPRAIHLETSSEDPYRKPNEALSRQLHALGVANTLRVPPGPHDQPWLREVGTLEMLLWHDRHLVGRAGRP